MALDQFKEVTFNEGEPLDPNKLNDIQKNTRTSFQASNIVYNSTLNAQSNPIVPVIKSGQINFGDVKMGETRTKILPSDLAVPGLPLPQVVASFRNQVAKGQHVTVSVHEISTNPSITVYVSGKDRDNLLVDWIAVTYKEVPVA